MRRVLHLFGASLLLIAIALGCLYYLAFTESGLQFLARQVNRRFGPVTIQLHGARGTLVRGVHVDLLVIDHRRAHIEIENADGRIAILPLMWQTIRVPEVHAERLLVHAHPRTWPAGPYSPFRFVPPLMRIEAEHATVDRWRLITTNDNVLDSTSVTATGTVYPSVIRVYGSTLNFNGVHVQSAGDIRAADSIGLTGTAHLSANPVGRPAWTVASRFDGSLTRLTLDADISEPFDASFHGIATDLAGAWHWQGNSQVRRFELEPWHVGNQLGVFTGRLALEGSHAGFTAKGPVDIAGLHAGALDADFAGRLTGRLLTVSQLTVHHPGSNATAVVTGSVDWTGGPPNLDLHADWRNFRWPLANADAPVHSGRGSGTLQGVIPYAVSANGELLAGSLQPLQISLRGRLGAEGLSAEQAQVSAYGAEARVQADLRWPKATPAIWQLKGRVEGLEVSQLRPGFNGQVGFDINASGRGFNNDGALSANFSNLAGSIRGQAAAGHAAIEHQNGAWSLEQVRLQLGATRINADARFDQSVDAKFDVQAEDLALLTNDAHGHLSATGQVRGTLRDLTLITNIKAHDLEWNGARLDALEAAITFDPHGSARADSAIELQGLTYAGRRLDRLSLHTDGTTTTHNVAFEARAEGMTLTARGNGHYLGGSWQTELIQADLSDQKQLHMQLEANTALLLSADQLKIGSGCLRGETARLCGQMTINAGERAIELRAIDLPMTALTAGVSAATDYEGTLGVTVAANAPPNAPWRGTLHAQLANAAIRRHFPNGRTESLALGTGNVDAELTEHQLSGTLALDAGNAGHINGKIDAHGDDVQWRNWPLSGELTLETTALGFIDSYVSQIDRASGRLNAQLSLAGTAAAPELGGALQLRDGQLDAYQINLSLRDLAFSAQLAANTLTLNGSASAGPDGKAAVSGQLHWTRGLPYGDLHLTGSDLRVLAIPEARVDASPDVTLHMDGQRIDVKGKVLLPYARIAPADLANAVLPSSDEVIVGEDTNPVAEQFKIYSDLTLVLGERVTVNTQGLSGRLSGAVTVTTDDTGINRGSGELKVEEGKYLAYGRNLDVEHGRLLFSNGLLSDPGLDLRATKTFPDITAGVNVRGTLRAPRMTFFSNPEVSQSQIVSLLLAGGSLETVQNTTTPGSDTTARSNAERAEMIGQGGAILAQQLGNRFDIEAGVEQDLDNQTALVLGRYLSPRLYISYGIGLAETLNTVKLRYTIGDHWTIKTEAGTARSADLVFTIEK